MAHSKREIKPGRAHTKVSGDVEMLRTGFYDGTPLEGGKIADSQPVDLFAAARRVAEADADAVPLLPSLLGQEPHLDPVAIMESKASLKSMTKVPPNHLAW
ncbi:unnamed protein product [Miscanthus lutarioriparius]|uniref:Uncharacterized protein n=1 Tax=Miscanthus lutarioriparius TaxID=422564 RepID=A0A811PR05_9POAL|nr:unnamed protein product [Miscanthus lutarioriparius]